MAQPKVQLDTFKAWAGLSSDINYYLNSHHIDIHNWMGGCEAHNQCAAGVLVCGCGAEARPGRPCTSNCTNCFTHCTVITRSRPRGPPGVCDCAGGGGRR